MAELYSINGVLNEISKPLLPSAQEFDHFANEKLETLDLVIWESKRKLTKTTPSSSPRYHNTKCVDTFPMSFEPQHAFEDFTAGLGLSDWTPHVHPEGSMYYYNAAFHVVTEANLRMPYIRSRVTHWMSEFEATLSRSSVKLPESYELLLELHPEEDQCGYYLVDHGRETVFWLDTANTEDLNLPDVSSKEHLKLKLQQLYWVHLEYFPAHGTLPGSAESTLVGILTHAWGDQATSSLSTAPYSTEQCKSFLSMLDRLIAIGWIPPHAIARWDAIRCVRFFELKDAAVSWRPRTSQGNNSLSNLSKGLPDQDGYKTCVIARVMGEIVHSRFINLYGNPESARLARNQSTLPVSTVRESRLLQTLCSTFLCQYRKELKDLKELWMDNIVYTEHWRAFLKSRLQEWRSLSLLSAMLILVDTLLVINYHTNSATLLPNLSVVKIGNLSATISLLLSLSTTIIGVTTIIIHQPYANSHASDANAYLDRASHETLGLQPLAIVLSLPRSLFLWALVTGGIALLSFSFQILDSWSIVFVGMFAFSLCALLVWVVRFFQGGEADLNEPEESFTGKLTAPFEGLPNRLFGKHKNTPEELV